MFKSVFFTKFVVRKILPTMRLYHFLLLSTLTLIPSAAYAESRGVSVTTPQGRTVTVTPITNNIIKVSNLAPGERLPESGLLQPVNESEYKTTTSGEFTTLLTQTGVSVRIDSRTGGVDINAGADRAISDSGVRTTDNGRQTISISTMGSGSFYGAGERGYSFNLAGDTLVMYNKQNYGYTAGDPRIKQMNITMPLFLSSKGYAIVFDDHAAAEMIMSNPVVYTTEARNPVSYYFVNSTGTLADLTGELSLITGRQKLPPLWSLGYITSKYGYRTQSETEGVIDTLKHAGYPVDGIVLDLYWYGKEEDMGRLTWDPDQWPNHRAMLAGLKNKGVNTVIISQPYVLRNGKGLDNYNELSTKGLLLKDTLGNTGDVTIWVGNGGMFDVSNPETRRWLRERYKQLTEEGVGGWWGDLGEPEVHPENRLHANGQTTREYHNLYGNDWSSIISQLFEEEFADRRLMTMMRGGTTGLQRYSVFPWSTDVSRSWGGLQPQITVMLNSGLSGLGYMSHDVGGFAIDEAAPYDPELYVRWLQLGTFSPVLRTHAQRTAEPYKYPDQQHIILPLIKERYRWLPYNYTLAWENASQGLPLVRPLNFYTPSDTKFDNITDEYLWGHYVLVAPVMKQGATERDIVFPEGLWIDYNNPTKFYHGGDTVTYPAPLEVLPLFVRAGAFIPLADYDMDNTGDYRTDRYTINYYPYLGTSEGTIYEDDLRSPSSLSSGNFALLKLKGEAGIEGIDISVSSEGNYPEMAFQKELTFEVHLMDHKPSEVRIDGKPTRKWKYDQSTATLTIMTKWNPTSALSIEIR